MDYVTIKCEVFWAQLKKQNDLSGKYQVDLCKLSAGAVEALENMGLTINNKGDDRADFLTCKSTHVIRAFDNDGVEIDDDIGNGSKAIAVVGFFEWTFKGKKGRSANLKRLKVTEIVEYVAEQPTEEEAI
jgi:hypothetical protein